MPRTESQRILIRADASLEIGTGHVMRMLALAQACLRRRLDVCWLSAACPQPLAERVKSHGIPFEYIPSGPAGSDLDADKTLRHALTQKCDWIVLDGYHFGEPYQMRLRAKGFKVLVLDDYDYCQQWSADAILNHNLFAANADYETAPPHCARLVGPRYALLREEFRPEPNPRDLNHRKAIRRLLITLGGSDPQNATARILETLAFIEQPNLTIRVIIGATNPHETMLEQAAKTSPHRVELLKNPADMPALFQWTDGVISAGGGTCLEWLRYDLPACILLLADNQQRIVDSLLQRNLAHRLLEPNSPAHHAHNLSTLRDFIALGGATLDVLPAPLKIDAKGADRVAAFLHATLRITIATAPDGWFRSHAEQLASQLREDGHSVNIVDQSEEITSGDILLLLSFWGIVPQHVLDLNTHNLVVHESNLPQGRGWSPLSWQILNGENCIPVTLFEAQDAVDSGPIYRQESVQFEGHELLPELRNEIAAKTCELCHSFITDFPFSTVSARAQEGSPSYYKRRTPKDSQIDPAQSLQSQFPLLRIVDNAQYPAYFDYAGQRYTLRIEKASPSLENS